MIGVHVDPNDEHAKALGWLGVLVDQYGLQSVLDVGSGTGRALLISEGAARPRIEGDRAITEPSCVRYT